MFIKENQCSIVFLFNTVLAEVPGLSWFISCSHIFMEYSIGEFFAFYDTKKTKSNLKTSKVS